MIDKCVFRGCEVRFHTGNVSNDNIFTTIVGKNGSGKSRLLRDLVNSYAHVSELRRDRQDNDVSNLTDLEGDYPFNVIASSTSPFDKFPVPYKYFDHVDGDYYFYQGLRGLGSNNLSLSFMSRTLGYLIKALNYDSARVGTVMGVLDYLGYREFVVARFALEVPRDFIYTLIDASDPMEVIERYVKGYPRAVVQIRKLRSLFEYLKTPEERNKVIAALNYFVTNYDRPRIDALISSTGAIDLISGTLLTDHFTVLLDGDLLRLRDVTLSKKDVAESFCINDASSGEQCVLMALLGIAANIQDGSLICIDEPEICLHPQWQERYIELLMSTFSGFKGCHFIIATHSPQIISKLSSNNCYILDMQSGLTYDAKEFNNRSADFQLASIFGAPGYKNEYMNREILNALTVLGSGKELSEAKRKEIYRFIKLQNVLDESDPVKYLLGLLDDAIGAK